MAYRLLSGPGQTKRKMHHAFGLNETPTNLSLKTSFMWQQGNGKTIHSGQRSS